MFELYLPVHGELAGCPAFRQVARLWCVAVQHAESLQEEFRVRRPEVFSLMNILA